MSFSKPLFYHLRSLPPFSLPFLRRRLLPPSVPLSRLLSFATPEEAAAERRRRKRRLRIEPPISHRPSSPPQQRVPGGPRPNPNAPKLPEPVAALAGKRLELHNRILTLIRENDLEEAALLTRHSIYSNCRPTVFTCNAVLFALLRQARYADFLSLHRFVTQASVAPTVITHNLLLQVYCDCRKTDTALEHFRLLLKDDSPVLPSPTTYRILAKGLVDNGKLDQALELKDGMIDKALVPPDPLVYNFLMAGCVAASDPDKAVALFEELREKLGGGAVLNGAVYGNLMKAYFLKGMDKEAMDCCQEVLGEGSKVRFTALSYNSVLDALGRNDRLDDALHLFDRMIGEHNPPRRLTVNLGTFNVMVDAYCKAGKFEDAIAVFRRMGEQKCVSDTLSYNNLIHQLGENRLVGEAEELYKEMGERGINADEYTYILLVEACFGVGREDDAVGYFKKMVELNLRPNANSYNKVINGLVNVGRLNEAQGFFDQMPEREVKPNISSYEMLLKAYVNAGRLDDAIKTAKGILLDDSVALSDEMKDLLEGTLKKEGREEDIGKMYDDVEKAKAEAAARAAEEKARAEALAKEEEERKRAEAAKKEEETSRASKAVVEAVLGWKKRAGGEESNSGGPISSDSGFLKRLGIGKDSTDEKKAEAGDFIETGNGDEGNTKEEKQGALDEITKEGARDAAEQVTAS